MARPILLKHNPVTISHMGYGLASLLLCAFALFVCASHSRRRWRRWKPSCYGYGDHQEPVIQLNPEQQIMNYNYGDVDVTTCSGDGSLWKKNILMGGKCQLPDFSGVIMYDSAGNAVAPPKKQAPLLALTWK